jgi:UDP-GlcNAc:undecaprenyl-phosphate GlcNAc-1-phosphate transferase
MHFLMAFFLALMLVFALRPLGRKFGIYDIPDRRKNHNRPVLVIGGIAMVVAFKMSIHIFGPVPETVHYLMLALALTCVVGLIDDLYHLSSRSLFATQIMAGLIVIWFGGTEVQNLGNLFGFGNIHTGPLAIAFTLVCVLGVINAVNMSDGADGLAGFLVLISGAWFAVLAYLANMLFLCEISLVLMGVVLGFLAFNMRHPWRRQASIFMGNAGSLSLGLLITWFAVELSGKLDSPVTPITAVWVIAMPLMDMCRVMVSRIRQGKSPFVADHLHLHHMLSSVGYSVGQVVAIKGLVSFVMGAVGVGAWYIGVPEWVMFYGFIATLGVYFYLLGSGWRHVCHIIERRRLFTRS